MKVVALQDLGLAEEMLLAFWSGFGAGGVEALPPATSHGL